MSKKLSIDRTVNGTQISNEDPMKSKLKKIADSKVYVPPPDLIIKKIKEKLDSRVILEHTNKPLKSTMIRLDCESGGVVPSNATTGLPNTNHQLNLKNFKHRFSKDSADDKKSGWNKNLNIPYYRKIMKIPLAQLKNELEHIVPTPPPDLLKISMSHQNLKSLVNSPVLPPILTPSANNQYDPRTAKISIYSTKDDILGLSKSRQSVNKFSALQKYDSKNTINHGDNDMLISGNTLTVKNQSLLATHDIMNTSMEKKSITQQKMNFKAIKNRKNFSQDSSLTRIQKQQDDHLPNINLYKDLMINNIRIEGDLHGTLDSEYRTALNSGKKVIKLSQKKVNQALMRWNEQRIKDRYQSNQHQQTDQQDLIGDCLMINHNEKQFEQSHQTNKIVKTIPSVENLMKQLNL